MKLLQSHGAGRRLLRSGFAYLMFLLFAVSFPVASGRNAAAQDAEQGRPDPAKLKSQLDRLIHRHQWTAAQKILQQLDVMGIYRSETARLQALVFTAQGDYFSARKQVDRAIVNSDASQRQTIEELRALIQNFAMYQKLSTPTLTSAEDKLYRTAEKAWSENKFGLAQRSYQKLNLSQIKSFQAQAKTESAAESEAEPVFDLKTGKIVKYDPAFFALKVAKCFNALEEHLKAADILYPLAAGSDPVYQLHAQLMLYQIRPYLQKTFSEQCEKANTAKRQGDLAAAIEALQLAVRARRDNPQVHFQIACVYALNHQDNRAVQSLEQSNKLAALTRELMLKNQNLWGLVRSPLFNQFLKDVFGQDFADKCSELFSQFVWQELEPRMQKLASKANHQALVNECQMAEFLYGKHPQILLYQGKAELALKRNQAAKKSLLTWLQQSQVDPAQLFKDSEISGLVLSEDFQKTAKSMLTKSQLQSFLQSLRDYSVDQCNQLALRALHKGQWLEVQKQLELVTRQKHVKPLSLAIGARLMIAEDHSPEAKRKANKLLQEALDYSGADQLSLDHFFETTDLSLLTLDARTTKLFRSRFQLTLTEAAKSVMSSESYHNYNEAGVRNLVTALQPCIPKALVFQKVQQFVCGKQRCVVAQFLHKPSGAVFHLLPGGTFNIDVETPAAVAPFFVAQTELTVAQCDKLFNPKSENSILENMKAKPKTKLSFVQWQSTLKVRKELRMLTENEWNYAARAKTKSRYYFGPLSRQARDYGWFGFKRKDSGLAPKDVKLKRPNAFGLYDMYGNVAEYCVTLNTGISTWGDRPTEAQAIVCGGSIVDSVRRCHSGAQAFIARDQQSATCGVRLAISLK